MFDKVLERLQEAVDCQRGQRDIMTVRRNDLRELLYHFNRLDHEARIRYYEEHPEMAQSFHKEGRKERR